MEYIKNESFSPDEQNDIVDNAVYQMLLTMLGETEKTFPWNMAIIGPVADIIEKNWKQVAIRCAGPFGMKMKFLVMS